MKFRQTVLLIFCSLWVLTPLGCQQKDEIRSYPVPSKHEDLMLAAIVPEGDQWWFFKVVGPIDAVLAKKEVFQTFFKSVQFSGGIPSWTLPEGWKQKKSETKGRFATLQLESNKVELELSVTQLPRRDQDETQYILQNVNRWREQMGLTKISQEHLSTITSQLRSESVTATLVTLAGTRPSLKAAPGIPLKPTEKVKPLFMQYDVPEGWEQGEKTPFAQDSFQVLDGQKLVRITISPLGGSGGALLANVNRWHRQIRLDPITQEQLDDQLKKIEVDGVECHYIEITAPETSEPRESILVIMLPKQDRTWFFKLKGDADLALREKKRFESFVQSVTFVQGDGADDGQK